MTREVHDKLQIAIETRYGEKMPPKTRNAFRVLTYDIEDVDAAKVFDDITSATTSLPKIELLRKICFNYRASTKIRENTEKCFACLDDGVVFWTEKCYSLSAFCPLCEKGASLIRRAGNRGGCDPMIARAALYRHLSLYGKENQKEYAEKYKQELENISFKNGRGIEIV